MSRLIYVAAPYSSPDEAVVAERMNWFSRAMGAYVLKGETVVSPLGFHYILPHNPELGTDWGVWEAYSKSLMYACHGLRVIKMPGWEDSSGVLAEIVYARHLSIPVEFVEVGSWEAALK